MKQPVHGQWFFFPKYEGRPCRRREMKRQAITLLLMLVALGVLLGMME